MRELHPLEQVDIMELEKMDLRIKFVENSIQVLSNARDSTAAEKLIEALKEEFFVGYTEKQEAKRKIAIEELMAIQKMTFNVTHVGKGGATLEVGRRSE